MSNEYLERLNAIKEKIKDNIYNNNHNEAFYDSENGIESTINEIIEKNDNALIRDLIEKIKSFLCEIKYKDRVNEHMYLFECEQYKGSIGIRRLHNILVFLLTGNFAKGGGYVKNSTESTENVTSGIFELPKKEKPEDEMIKKNNPKGENDMPKNNNQPLNQILYGPPGTGKTYNTINKALSIIENKSEADLDKEKRIELKKKFNRFKEDGQIQFITFHQSYAYEEFIEGIKPKAKKCDEEDDNKDISYCIKDGVFKRLADKARKNLESDADTINFVLIIDEINRGNISKIFGELITLIEDSKRVGSGKEDTTARLPYSDEEFGVPNNLYIIGTMNTADRSIAHIDTALRRRFEFIEMMPKTGDKDNELDFDVLDINIKNLLKAMNERIEVLYDREHTIGHAYFMDLNKNSTIGDLAHIFKNKIIPLLAEYFYSDWSKINLVFNDNSFINEEERKVGNISKRIYSIDENQLKNLQNYKNIILSTGNGGGE